MANPFITSTADTAIVNISAELPLYTEYAWDFENDRFLIDANRQHIIVVGNEALKVWIYKALKVERWRYVAYHSAYGVELEKYIGKSNIKPVANLMKQDIIDCLMVNPYILSIDSIEITKQEDDIVQLTISLTTIYSAFTVSYTL